MTPKRPSLLELELQRASEQRSQQDKIHEPVPPSLEKINEVVQAYRDQSDQFKVTEPSSKGRGKPNRRSRTQRPSCDGRPSRKRGHGPDCGSPR